MRTVNRAEIIGNLGDTPEVRNTGDGTAVCNLSVATSESYTNKSGEEVENTQWHRVVLWDKLAELAGQYLKKGSKVRIVGPIQYGSYEDADGNTRYTVEIKGRELMFLDSKGASNGTKPKEDLPF